jgi:hypothetical protein
MIGAEAAPEWDALPHHGTSEFAMIGLSEPYAELSIASSIVAEPFESDSEREQFKVHINAAETHLKVNYCFS